MPSQKYQLKQTVDVADSGPKTYLAELMDRSWSNSPRDALGRLKLVSNAYRLRKQTWAFPYAGSTNTISYGYDAGGSLRALEASELDPVFSSLYNSAYGRLRGRLYSGSSALGVTFGSWRQSREMVVDRYQQLASLADRKQGQLDRLFRRGRLSTKAIAGTHLEIIFGWIPLIKDVHKACATVISDADKHQFVTGAARTAHRKYDTSTGGAYQIRKELESWLSVKLSTRVVITNPNLWLIERAGLLNPVAVAWDLVPWSFVVNMFVNIGSLVNSISDFAGLSFPDKTTTYTARSVRRVYSTYRYGDPHLGGVVSTEVWKQRQKSGFTRPSMELRVPGVNWESAAMAASLFTQKFQFLQRRLT